MIALNYKSRIKNHPDDATAYTQRKANKHHAEQRLVARAMQSIRNDCQTMLDAPCGVGRFTVWFAERGFQTTGIDLGKAALQYSQLAVKAAGVNAKILQEDIEQLSFNTQSFDTVFCFRLLHHFPTMSIKHKVITELCRVAKKYVIISYLSPASYTFFRRKIRKLLFNHQTGQHHTPLRELDQYFAINGFHRVKDFAQKPFLHALHLTIYQRD